jgi:hypothetical protein
MSGSSLTSGKPGNSASTSPPMTRTIGYETLSRCAAVTRTTSTMSKQTTSSTGCTRLTAWPGCGRESSPGFELGIHVALLRRAGSNLEPDRLTNRRHPRGRPVFGLRNKKRLPWKLASTCETADENRGRVKRFSARKMMEKRGVPQLR